MDTLHDQNSHCIDVCNRLLRGEISAVEAYSEAIHKFEGEPEVRQLKHIREEHIRAANLLRSNIQEMGGDPDTASGAWGSFVETLQRTANLFGENSAVGLLKQGEKHGRNEYEEALSDNEVLGRCKMLITLDLLPKIDEHLSALKQLEE